MFLESLDRRIRAAFSDAAIQYDILASLHKDIGRELCKKIFNVDVCTRILDVGMGTGVTTNRLNMFCPDSQVVGIDFAAGMVEQARRKYDHVTFLQADARAFPFREDTFDVVLSNLAYQWIWPLDRSFQGARQVLRPEGSLLVTLFGRETFHELFTTFEQTAPAKRREHRFRRLPSMDDVEQALTQAGFREIQLKREVISVPFKDMTNLLHWARDIGANALNPSFFIGPAWMRAAREYYRDRFPDRFGVTSTFEVIWIEAKG